MWKPGQILNRVKANKNIPPWHRMDDEDEYEENSGYYETESYEYTRYARLSLPEAVDYYDLVEIEWDDHRVGHMPATWFTKDANAARWLMTVPQRNGLVRDGNFFSCPICHIHRSFYAGPCVDCVSAYRLKYGSAKESDIKESMERYEKERKIMSVRKMRLMDEIISTGETPPSIIRVEYVMVR